MRNVSILFYSIICYGLGLLIVAVYADFFVGLYLSKYINSPIQGSLLEGIMVNLLLVLVFSLQHSVMARKPFKKWLTQYIPAAAERSTYVLATVMVTMLLVYCWRPLPVTLFDLRGTSIGHILWVLFGTGWFIGLFSTFLINHFDLFGLSQAWSKFRKKETFGYTFKTPLFYKLVRHPIYTGWLLIHWANPHFTLGNLLLATGITVYIFIAIGYEEKDLMAYFGEQYGIYRQRVPKVIPSLRLRK
jgi:methanethiol S-methyltransferase